MPKRLRSACLSYICRFHSQSHSKSPQKNPYITIRRAVAADSGFCTAKTHGQSLISLSKRGFDLPSFLALQIFLVHRIMLLLLLSMLLLLLLLLNSVHELDRFPQGQPQRTNLSARNVKLGRSHVNHHNVTTMHMTIDAMQKAHHDIY